MNARRPRVAAISLCPVKSRAMREVEQAQVGRYGLLGDREWMVVEPGLSGHAAFQDRSPVSLLSTASLDQLNDWIGGRPLQASRFRSNLLVAGVRPFAEDGWQAVRIGDAELRVAGPISRCVMTGIDPITRDRGKEPIRTLARRRRWDGKTWFAVHLLVEQPGLISTGDVVEYT